MSTPPSSVDTHALAASVAALPGVPELRAAAGEVPIHLVGGAVRDLLRSAPADLDVAVEGDPVPIARRLGGEVHAHEHFGTVSTAVDGRPVDLARTRTETYPEPGALPVVSWAGIDEDLARRDFTVNAMAVPLCGEPRVLDPFGGAADLDASLLRVLHERSFEDDPTRTIRAARYASRLDLELEEQTRELLAGSDLRTVSAERAEAELRRLAAEAQAVRGLALLVEWGVVEADLELGARAHAFATADRFAGLADPASVLLAASAVRAGSYSAGAELNAARELAAVDAGLPPSALTAHGRGRGGVELVIARALGAEWIDSYVSEWRGVRLEIGGADLLDAGVRQGPRVGRGLAAALDAKLDGEAGGREAELDVALRAAED
jgi:tRNA nucleotidyltransferase (CCA-adding enzyme)